MTDDEALAESATREWLGADATREPLVAMNSSAWAVTAGAHRYVLRISDPGEEAGLQTAALLEERGLRTGAPVQMGVRGDRLVALLRFVDGRGLGSSEADVELLGQTLGRAHTLLVGAPVPDGLRRWPWAWFDPAIIEEADLRAAATQASTAAQAVAPTLTHGILQGDPAPEAFLADGDDVTLIDWGSAVHGPFLFDVASALMYTNARVVEAYARTGPLGEEELAHVPTFLAYRWVVQAWYFSDRIRRHDLTGLVCDADNEKGLNDARRALLGASS